MVLSPTRVLLVAALVVAVAVVWHVEGRKRWRTRLEHRFIYGVPWGTLVTVAVVVAFYLLAQGGLRNPSNPVIYPFITWSYLYPTGLLTAGIAHANPGHIVSNMTGTLAFAPIAEYVWSHYVPSRESSDRRRRRLAVTNPWVRAVVVFPVALLAAAFVTAVFSLGPGLGFSGALFAIVGFSVVNYPFATVVAVVVSSVLGTLFRALTEPVVRETIEASPPMPPAWAGIGFQAHLLGFLLGAVVAIALLRHRGRSPAFVRVFFGTLLTGTALSLWLLVWSADDVFSLYRGAGVTMVVVLSLLVAAASSGTTRRVPRPLSVLPWAPTRRQLAVGWLLFVVVVFSGGVAGVVIEGQAVGLAIATLFLVAVLLAAPAIPPLLPDRVFEGAVTRRGAALGVLVAFTLVVAAPSIPLGLAVVDDTGLDRGVEVDGYTVAYAENVTSATTPLVDFGNETQFDTEQSGVIVVNEKLEMWTIGERKAIVEHEGNATVVVGGVGWHEPVEIERTGWEVLGNDTAYVVDVEADDETTRTFESDPVRANAYIDGRTVEVVPTADAFVLRIEGGGETTIPEMGETATVEELTFETREIDDTARVFVSTGETEVQIAERET